MTGGGVKTLGPFASGPVREPDYHNREIANRVSPRAGAGRCRHLKGFCRICLLVHAPNSRPTRGLLGPPPSLQVT